MPEHAWPRPPKILTYFEALIEQQLHAKYQCNNSTMSKDKEFCMQKIILNSGNAPLKNFALLNYSLCQATKRSNGRIKIKRSHDCVGKSNSS